MTNYRIPAVRCALVREGTVTAETRGVERPADAAAIYRAFVGDADRETLVALLLDVKNRVNAVHVVSVGDLTSSIIHPREVFTAALLHKAAALILCHGHPSGDPTPSAEDVSVTRRCAEAGELLAIKLLDHVVVGHDRHVSLRERGQM